MMRLAGPPSPNPRPACHAEGRGFESHHPLSGKPRKRGAFVVSGVNDKDGVATEWQRSFVRSSLQRWLDARDEIGRAHV